MGEKLIYQYQFTSDYPVLQFVIFGNYDLGMAHANMGVGKKKSELSCNFFLLNPTYCKALAKRQ